MMVFDEDTPSCAAILLAEVSVADAVRTADAALAAERYARHDRRLPAHAHALPDEWFGVLFVPAPACEGVALIPHDPSVVWQLALHVSAGWEDRLVVAWQRLKYGNPVAKYLAKGRPEWKDGTDRDHEVGWHIPSAPPAERRFPPLGKLPDSALGVQRLLASVLRPFPRGRLAAADAGEAIAGYISRRSPHFGR